MAKLYREVILKEKPVEAGFVPFDSLAGPMVGIKPAPKPVEEKAKSATVGSLGD